MTTPALFDVPSRARQGPGANDLVLVDAKKADPKAHRAHEVLPWRPGARPDRASRPGKQEKVAYDGDDRRTACGWVLGYTRHYLLVQLAESIPLCRSCWPVKP